jgi:hypothetical protein
VHAAQGYLLAAQGYLDNIMRVEQVVARAAQGYLNNGVHVEQSAFSTPKILLPVEVHNNKK